MKDLRSILGEIEPTLILDPIVAVCAHLDPWVQHYVGLRGRADVSLAWSMAGLTTHIL